MRTEAFIILRCIPKHTPAVVLGLLVVAWVMSAFGWAAYLATINQRNFVGGIGGGTFGLWTYLDRNPATTARGFGYGFFGENDGPWQFDRVAGGFDFGYDHVAGGDQYTSLYFPVAFAITLLLPLAIGSFTNFRSRLWHYLAYTALVAVQLAYYLQWQE